MKSISNFLAEAQRKVFRKLGVDAYLRDIKIQEEIEPIFHSHAFSNRGYSVRGTQKINCSLEIVLDSMPHQVPVLKDKMDEPVFTLRDVESLMLALSVGIESEKDRLEFQKKYSQWSKSKLYEIDVYSNL